MGFIIDQNNDQLPVALIAQLVDWHHKGQGSIPVQAFLVTT